MNGEFSTSIFTLEADRRPVVTFAAEKHADAEEIGMDERIREKLRSLTSEGLPVCDHLSILRVRLARPDERALYRMEDASPLIPYPMVFLIELDPPSERG